MLAAMLMSRRATALMLADMFGDLVDVHNARLAGLPILTPLTA